MSLRARLRFFVLALVLLPGCPTDPMPDVPATDTPTRDGMGIDTNGMDVPGLDANADVPGLDAPGLDGGMGDAGDGGMMMGTVITICPGDALPSFPSAACEATSGSASILITADILTPGEVFRGGQVLVDATGTISCVGCDCSAGAAGATTVVCPDGVLSPGLINAHEHLTFQGVPYTATAERYEHRHDWRRGLRGHTEIDAAGAASSARIAYAELRYVMGGATSINGSGASAGFLRNLDRSASMEGLGQPQVDYDTFPLGDSGGTLLTTGCGYPMINTNAAISALDSYTPHLAEGIDAAARNEVVCVSMGATDLIEPQTALIHGVGLGVSDIFAVREGGSTLIWSPRSNVTLYGDTARAPIYDRLGVPIALGTDWIFTGSMNMLRELTCADELNNDYFDGYFSDEDLWLMATYNGAVATATDDVLGIIRTGYVADLAVFDARVNADHRAVIDADGGDVLLVLRGGRTLYGDAAVVAAMPGGAACDPIDVCGEMHAACVSAEVGGMTLASLRAANAGAYDLFACAGTPPNEPSCHPARNAMAGLPSPTVAGSTRYTGMITATDGDGDGIADATDLCPSVFDPVRPMDGGEQPDFDLDGVGDACDPCPFDVTSACTLPDPTDRDADGVTDTMDNCVGVFNPMQEDADGDMRGDACDACPMDPNPGMAPCPATIYEIKDGTIATGQAVAVTNGLVTARLSNGFFMQTKVGDTGYMGSDYSGIFVFTGGAPTAAVGNRVDVSGVVQDFFGQLQISMSTVTITSATVEAPPAPIVVTPAEAATGGARAGRLEGVVVTTSDVGVTAVNATFNEFTLDGSLIVDDAAFLVTPLPSVGQRFLSITGVLAFRNSNSKLLPRSAADVVGSLLAGFGPTPSFVRAGSAGAPTIPTPLTVTLGVPAASSTFVAIASSNPTALTVVGGGVTIPSGSTSAPVLVNGLAAASVTLTATLSTEMQTAVVRVVGAGEMPVISTLTPASSVVATGGSQPFTVTLDIPAPPGGTSVALALSPPGAGTLPPTVTVPADQTSAMFTLVGVSASAMVTATLGASSASSMVTVSAGSTGLVINEVDYDMVGTGDAEEYVELFNSGTATIDLSSVALVLVNGMSMPPAEYDRVGLSGTLAPGAYLVITSSTAVVGRLPGGTRSIAFMGAGTANRLQNGAPDGVVLIDTVMGSVIDRLSYEGAITTAAVTGLGTISLVEGMALAASVADSNSMIGSLCRIPNGSDTNEAATDWAFSGTPTPGAANVP